MRLTKNKFLRINKKYFVSAICDANNYVSGFEALFLSLYNNNVLFYSLETNFPDSVSSDDSKMVYIRKLIDLLNNIELIDFAYLTYKKKKVKVLIGIRCFLNNNKQLLANIYNYLLHYPISVYCLRINELDNIKSINYFFYNLISCDLKFHHFNLYSDTNKLGFGFYSFVCDMLAYIDMMLPNKLENIINKYSTISGYKDKELNKSIIYYIWNLYFQINNLYITKENNILVIYKKYISSISTYQIFNYGYFLSNNFKDIVRSLENIFKVQLSYLFLYEKTLPFLKEAYSTMADIEVHNIFENYFEFSRNYIEFLDGVYDIYSNKFLPINNFASEKIKSFLYFNLEYNQLLYNSNVSILSLKDNIINYFSSPLNIITENKYTLVDIFLKKLAYFINSKIIFFNDVVTEDNKVFIVVQINTLLHGNVRSESTKDIVDLLAPFFILIQLYQKAFSSNSSLDELINNYNFRAYEHNLFGIYHPVIKDFHKENYISFLILINSFYINNL